MSGTNPVPHGQKDDCDDQVTGPTAKDIAKMPTPDLIKVFNKLNGQGPNISLEDMVTCKMAEDLIRKRRVAK